MRIRGIPGAERPLVQWLLILSCALVIALAVGVARREHQATAALKTMRANLEEASRVRVQLEAQVARERAAREAFEIGFGQQRAANNPAAVPLHPGLSPTGRPTQELRIPPDASRVLLALPLTARRFDRYRAAVRPWSGGDEIWAHGRLRPPASDPRRLLVAVPADVLSPGAYELSLRGITADGRSEDVAVFTFEVDTHGSSR